MRIQTAIKTGKPFRRRFWAKKYKEWYSANNKGGGVGFPVERVFPFDVLLRDLSKNDILATDWEIYRG